MLWATWIDTRLIDAACSATTPAETNDGMSGALSDPSIITHAVRCPQDSSDKELFEEHQKMHSGGVYTHRSPSSPHLLRQLSCCQGPI